MLKSGFVQFVTLMFIINCVIGLWSVDFPAQKISVWQLTGTSAWLFEFGMAVSVCTTIYMLLQAVLVGFYRTKKAAENQVWPNCSVLVPAYNEGQQVYKTVMSILHSDYPAEKMEIIAIDDGSSDDTWQWIEKAVQDSHGRVRGLRQEKNGGKKRALCRGIAESSNEIIVTIDSDSMLYKDAIRNLLIPFPQYPKVGAVAGNIRVKNMRKGLLPRMLDVAFVFGCDFMRSAQSVIGRVLCTPGAISAYRRTAVQPLCEKWLNQTFFNAPATIGEDRALTSLLLRNGWNVICQNNAIALTEVPDTYTKLCKMLLRWTRGDLRESILLLSFVCSRWSLLDWRWICFQLNIFSQIIGVMLPFIFIPCTILSLFMFSDHVLFIFYYTFSINGVWSLLPAIVYARRTSIAGIAWAFLYGIFSLIALSWICIYSLFTVRNSNWMTRSKKAC